MLKECLRNPTTDVDEASNAKDLPNPISAESTWVGKSRTDVENINVKSKSLQTDNATQRPTGAGAREFNF